MMSLMPVSEVSEALPLTGSTPYLVPASLTEVGLCHWDTAWNADCYSVTVCGLYEAQQ